MTPKRLSSDENKESDESASVSDPQHSISGFTGISPGVKLQHTFSSCSDLPPPPHPSKFSITSLHLQRCI
ncbi:hypothetical protein E2C01_027150 [Portunus trituberculatus]|uniref:Uncharacterized protein n=1 Tax=Portunus trituberculatus TaxID=210409 RepID=A0A5B7EKK4_PORTR|nr:hypothetical protein [Portunus trituberculatus]